MAPLAEKIYEATMQHHIPPSTVSVQFKGLSTSPAGFIPSGPENVLGQIGPFTDSVFPPRWGGGGGGEKKLQKEAVDMHHDHLLKTDYSSFHV
jgi:hypothetical protein